MIRITEGSLYQAIYKVFKEFGANVIMEPKKVTEPDFIIDWIGEKWLVSVKIGDIDKPKFIKDAFIQLFNELRDFSDILKGSGRAILLIYPEDIRKIKPEESEIERAIREVPTYAIVLRPQIELREILPEVLKSIDGILRKKLPTSLSLKTVITLLKAQIEELMSSLRLDGGLISMIKDPSLFFGINPVETREKRQSLILSDVLRFLGAYIFLSQALFLRLYYEKVPKVLENIDPRDITKDIARKLFNKVKEINYRPIFDIDVVDYIPEKLITDTFRLLFALQIENIRYELPGRLFHELMPEKIRKLLAAFYTRPIAAYLLAQLTIEDPNATVFDPACGSGTILTMAYRRKRELWRETENPHKKFCEEQIFGSDIMPFAVHLTNANLIAMDPLIPIDHTQIILGDSLQLAFQTKALPGYRTLIEYFAGERKEQIKANAYNREGKTIEIYLKPVDVILMNPPFTKVERGIKKYINTEKFEHIVGGEVGLWGHFVALADVFLKDEGIFGAVLPINLLRGRESKEVRNIIFKQWLPLYIIKPSKNYGFSEYAEYRDILVIAKKTTKKPNGHKVKFCIIKKDLNELTEEEAKYIAEHIKKLEKYRSELFDIESYELEKLYKRFDNLMYFIAGPSLDTSESLHKIIEEAERLFDTFPKGYFKEGYGPRPENSSKFMFITRPGEGRDKEAFLTLENETSDTIIARTPVGVQKFAFSKKHFLPALRTPVGLKKIDVSISHDYVAKEPYENMDHIMKLSDFKAIEKINEKYWKEYIRREFERASTYLTVVRRVNPYSPQQSLLAFNSRKLLIVSDLFHAINEPNETIRKAVAVLLNSIFSLAYIFSSKEESTGRYIDLRQYDFYAMKLYPRKEQVNKLVAIYEKYKNKEFPALREQLDIYFDTRYEVFWMQEREKQRPLIHIPPIEPHPIRLEFDLEIAQAVGSNLTKEDIIRAYEAIVWDMIITRGLRKD